MCNLWFDIFRLKFGTETFTGTGPNFKAAKQNAAATALAQTKYPKPTEKKTMKVSCLFETIVIA